MRKIFLMKCLNRLDVGLLEKTGMDDYSYAAQQMKEAIISDYLKKHPGVQRHEVLTKLVNGRYVVGTIEDVFKEMQGRRKGQIAQLNRRELLSELSRGETNGIRIHWSRSRIRNGISNGCL